MYPKKRLRLDNISIYRSQQGLISDSPNTPFERVGEVFEILIIKCFAKFCDGHRTPNSDTYGGLCYTLSKKLGQAEERTNNAECLHGVHH